MDDIDPQYRDEFEADLLEADLLPKKDVILRIAVAARGDTLESELSPLFGRAPFFVLVDSDGHEILSTRSITNSGAEQQTGAGVTAAHTLESQSVNVLITLSMDKHSFEALRRAGISVYYGMTGSVEDNILLYLRGKLPPFKPRWDHPSSTPHPQSGKTPHRKKTSSPSPSRPSRTASKKHKKSKK